MTVSYSQSKSYMRFFWLISPQRCLFRFLKFEEPQSILRGYVRNLLLGYLQTLRNRSNHSRDNAGLIFAIRDSELFGDVNLVRLHEGGVSFHHYPFQRQRSILQRLTNMGTSFAHSHKTCKPDVVPFPDVILQVLLTPGEAVDTYAGGLDSHLVQDPAALPCQSLRHARAQTVVPVAPPQEQPAFETTPAEPGAG